MKDALLSLYVQGYLANTGTDKVPDPKRQAPGKLGGAVDIVLGIAGWAGTAAGVAGIIVTGVMMAVSVKRGEGSEHVSRLGMVMGGCILVACAGPTVDFFFSQSDGTGTGPGPGPGGQ